uniref:ISG15 ubiquitin like modifier n=1 Tax=Astyanax mexicanus TaxID=7994 RepID=A0A3B1JNV4_ASTMX
MLLVRKLFQVFVRNEKGQTKTYDVSEEETVDELKTKVYNKERTPTDQMRLVCGGKQLDSGTLKDYNIQSGSTIHMTLRLRGEDTEPTRRTLAVATYTIITFLAK